MEILHKNELLPLAVTDLTGLGSGFAKTESGLPVFIPGALPGDRILCRIIKVGQSYLVGKIEAMLAPSADRVEAGCDRFGKCGGCSLRSLSYEKEKIWKQEFLLAALRKERLSAYTVKPVLSAGKRDGYRNKVQYPAANLQGKGVCLGYYAPHSHRVISGLDCPMQHAAFRPVLALLGRYIEESGISAYEESSGKGLLRHIFLRTSKDGEQIMVGIIANGDELPKEKRLLEILSETPAVKSVWLSVNRQKTNVILGKDNRLLFGEPVIEDSLLGLRFRISLPSFYQVNHDGCELLYREVLKQANLQAGQTLTDLFCGIGTIGLSMAAAAKGISLQGIEICPEAVENAKENARLNAISNARFFCGDADHPALTATDVVVVDPPRAGLSLPLVEKLCALSPKKILYVSCAPDTLARDLRRFADRGYFAGPLQPVDMFPGTVHVETVVQLSKG